MSISFSRLDDDQRRLVAAMGWDPVGETSLFLSPASAQELIVDPSNTPWTLSESSDVLIGEVTMDAGAETVTLFHDIVLPTTPGTANGWKINSFDVHYKVATASLTAADFKLITTNFSAALPTAAEQTVTGTETLVAGTYALTRTVTTPTVLTQEEAARLSLEFAMANTGVLTYYGTVLHIELDA